MRYACVVSREWTIMKRIVLATAVAVCAALASTAGFAQSVDCSAFEHAKNGDWVVTKAVRLAAVKDGVSKSIGLAPGERFARDGKTGMDGVAVFDMVEAQCH